ncbi:MAG: DUF1736 domain-containing protein [Bacteroidetes bacterium]|nr:DUF1736 domain-containing protein [Bacteroidota bacterium]
MKPKPTKKVHKQALGKKPNSYVLPEEPRDRWKILYFLILTVVAFGFYTNSLSNGYVLDDGVVINQNKFTTQGIHGIPKILTTDAFVGVFGEGLNLTGGRYRPLSILMFAVEYQLFGLNPFAGHLVNVLLYCLTGIIIYILMSRLLNYKWPVISFITALLFIIHPIHIEVVTNIKSRDEILCLLFSMLTVLFMLKNNKYSILLSSLLFFLALISKENAITFLAVIPLALYLFSKTSPKKIFIRVLPLFAVSLVYLYLRYRFAGILGDRTTSDIMEDPYLHATLLQKSATIAFTLWKYFLLLFYPYPLSYDYSYNQVPLTNWADWRAIVATLVFIGLILYSFWRFRTRSLVIFGILLFFITFSIVSNIFFTIGTSMGERFLYMPSLGFCILIGGIIKIKMRRGIMVFLLLCIVIGSFILVFQRNKDWKDNYTLMKTDVLTARNSARAHLYYGIELRNKFNETHDTTLLGQSIIEIKHSSLIAPAFHHALYNLGLAYMDVKLYDSAIWAFNKALELQPLHILSQNGLAISYLIGKGDIQNGIKHYEILVNDYHQTDPTYYDNFGIAYGMKNDFSKALQIFESGIEKNPGFAKLYLDAGITCDNLGDHEKAKIYYENAFRLDPKLKKR